MAYVILTEVAKTSRSGRTFSSSCRKIQGGAWDEWTWTDWVLYLNGSEFKAHPGLSGAPLNDSFVLDSRQDWYPCTSRKIMSAAMKVRGTGAIWGPWVKGPALNISPPFAPSMTLTVGTGANPEITAKSGFPSDAEDREVYDVVFSVTRRANFGTTSQTLHSATCTSSSDPNLEWEGNISDIEAGLTQDRWIEVTATTRARGFAGDSATTSKSHVFAWPGSPQITKVAVSGNVTSSGMVVISCKSNQSKYHPTDTVQLQMLKSSDAETAAQAATKSGWSDVSGVVDDGDCAGLTTTLADSYPDEGTRTWYRLKATHDTHVLYSAPAQLPVFDPVPIPGDIEIFSAVSGDDGASVAVDVGWETDQATKTQVSWGDSPNAWESTSGTTSYDFDWKDATAREGYDNSARVYITGLEEGKTYYVKARRVQERNGATTYGAWSSAVSVKPVSAPAWVELQAPAVVPRGESLPLMWTFGSDAAQTGWNVIGSDGKVWASGEDANGACSIPPEALEGVTSLSLMVSVTTGGEWKASDYKPVQIAEKPQCTVSADPTVDAQPVSVELEADMPDLSAVVSVLAGGITYVRPDGDKTQYSGDVVLAMQVIPSWTESEGSYTATLELPVTNLVNGSKYTVSATVTDQSTGLTSEPSECGFEVEWGHLAPAPECTVTADQEELTSTVSIGTPEGAAEGDVCDVYRLTPDGARLIAEGVAFGSAVTDRFAPFSGYRQTACRVAVRTADGDVTWSDFPYTLKGGGIRLNWGNRHLDLPYNVTADDQVEKPFEARTHMDGETEGYWDAGATRTSALSTDLIKLDSEEQVELIREMARYCGAVFVRVANGCAFDANVTLSKISESYSSGALAVSLDAAEVALTPEHMCDPADIAAPEVGGE